MIDIALTFIVVFALSYWMEKRKFKSAVTLLCSAVLGALIFYMLFLQFGANPTTIGFILSLSGSRELRLIWEQTQDIFAVVRIARLARYIVLAAGAIVGLVASLIGKVVAQKI